MTVHKKRNIQYRPRPSNIASLEVQNNEWVDTRTLNDQKNAANAEIDISAELARRKYVTAHPGQIGVYNEKYLDAKAYAEAGYPTISGAAYPFVQAEANATQITLQQAADLIIATREMWITLAAKIEEERRRYKINIENATTHEQIINYLNMGKSVLEQI